MACLISVYRQFLVTNIHGSSPCIPWQPNSVFAISFCPSLSRRYGAKVLDRVCGWYFFLTQHYNIICVWRWHVYPVFCWLTFSPCLSKTSLNRSSRYSALSVASSLMTNRQQRALHLANLFLCILSRHLGWRKRRWTDLKPIIDGYLNSLAQPVSPWECEPSS